MKAYLIAPETQTIAEIEVVDLEDIERLVGFETVESDRVGTQGDRLYFDEECFLRGTPGRFRVDTLVPVSGKGVVVGTVKDGSALRNVATGIDDLRARTRFL